MENFEDVMFTIFGNNSIDVGQKSKFTLKLAIQIVSYFLFFALVTLWAVFYYYLIYEFYSLELATNDI